MPSEDISEIDNIERLPEEPKGITGRLTFVKRSESTWPELGKVTTELKVTSLKTLEAHLATPVPPTPKILPRIKKN